MVGEHVVSEWLVIQVRSSDVLHKLATSTAMMECKHKPTRIIMKMLVKGFSEAGWWRRPVQPCISLPQLCVARAFSQHSWGGVAGLPDMAGDGHAQLHPGARSARSAPFTLPQYRSLLCLKMGPRCASSGLDASRSCRSPSGARWSWWWRVLRTETRSVARMPKHEGMLKRLCVQVDTNAIYGSVTDTHLMPLMHGVTGLKALDLWGCR